MPPRPPSRIPPLAASIHPTARERVLAQWRGIDLAPEERARRVLARPVQSVLQKVVERLGLDRRRSEAELVKVWNDLIDPAVTAHAQPSRLVRGTLFVTVDSSVWLSELVRYRYEEILDRLQHSFGRDKIRKISFRPG